MKLRLSLLAILSLFFSWQSVAQITVDNTQNEVFCVNNVLLGVGVTASNITFSGDADQIGTFDATGTTFPINGQGVILATGNVDQAIGPNNSGSFSLGGGNMGAGDPDLDILTNLGPGSTNDAAILEFDFIPVGDTVKFNYVFGSEEYLEFVNGGVNDAFGFFLSGPGIVGTFSSPAGFPNGSINIAQVPNGGGPVTIDNVNTGSNPTYYIDNETPPGVDVQYDGHTVVMTAIAEVQCGQTYHIKIAIADASDDVWDSGVFLEAESFASDAVEVNVATVTGDTTIIEGCDDVDFTFIRPTTDSSLTVFFDITGTAQNGIDYNFIADSVNFAIGQDSATITVATIEDDFTPGGNEAPESIIITVYTISPCGDTLVDSGAVWIIEEPALVLNISNDTTLTCPADSIQLSSLVSGGVPGYQYTWGTGENTQDIWVQGNVNGVWTYPIEVTDTCNLLTLYDTVQVTINVPPPLVVDLGPDTTLSCAGPLSLTATASGGAGGYSYSWNGGPNVALTTVNVNITANGYQYVEVTDACGTTTIDSIGVTIVPNLPILSVSNDTTINCPGDSAFMSASASGGNPPYVFDWTVTGNSTTTDTVNAMTTTTYYIELSDACTGAPVIDSVIVTVPVYDPLVITLPDQTPTCPGDNVVLSPTITGGNPAYQYQWDGNVTTNPDLTVNPSSNSSYTIDVTDACGTSATHTVNVNMPVYAPLTAGIFGPDTICMNLQGTLLGTSTGGAGGNTVVYSGPGDIISSTDSVALFVTQNSGDFIITITDQCGNTATNQHYVYAEACELTVPNVITTNGDGLNDFFVVVNLERFDNNVKVLNRWGKVVFEKDNYQNDWDGTNKNGKPLADGTYFYIITLKDGREYSGHLNVFND